MRECSMGCSEPAACVKLTVPDPPSQDCQQTLSRMPRSATAGEKRSWSNVGREEGAWRTTYMACLGKYLPRYVQRAHGHFDLVVFL